MPARSVTTTYTDPTGKLLTRVGYGRNAHEAERDARRKLPPGFVVVESYTSTVESILRALRRSE